jgi:protocatechuate 3,4-dioxygenase beta subunit
MVPRAGTRLLLGLLLAGSLLFLVSGAVAWFLRWGDARVVERGEVAPLPSTSSPDRSAAAPGARSEREGASEAPSPVATREPVETAGVEAAYLVEGRVVGESGEPVVGASVALELGPGATPLALTTAGDGRFTFLGSEETSGAELPIVLLATAPERAPKVARATLEAGARLLDVGEIVLGAGGAISGRVLDERGLAVADAIVTLAPTSSHPLAGWSRWSEVVPPLVTDAAGAYEARDLAPGGWRVSAVAPRMLEGRLRDSIVLESDEEVRADPIRLAAGFELAGVVLAADESPVAGAAIEAMGGGAARVRQRATTGRDGRFRLDHLPSGNLRVEASAPGFLPVQIAAVDATSGAELRLVLHAGASVQGLVVDAATKSPLLRYAARLVSLRGGRDAASARLREASSFREARRASRDLGPVLDRPDGRFRFTGLEAGLHVVEIASDDHLFASSEPFDATSAVAPIELRIEAVRGVVLRGSVTSRVDGSAIEGARVELLLLDGDGAEDPRDGARTPFGWAFAPPSPRGAVLDSTRTDAQGRFTIARAPLGRCVVRASHAGWCRASSAPIETRADRDEPDEARLALAPAARLEGKVEGVPAGRERGARVLLVGDGTLRTAKVDAAGAWRIEGLQPGSYALRAFLGDPESGFAREVAALFADERAPAVADVVLGEGETRSFDLRLELPPVGAVAGSVTVNGQPAAGFEVVLRPKSPIAGTSSPRTVLDRGGRFRRGDLAPGDYTLLVLSTANRQEVHRASIQVAAGATAQVDAILSIGGVRGRVTTDDGTPPDRIEGTITLLPGETKPPDDVRRHAQSHRVHVVRVRAGRFEADPVTAGPALVLIEVRGRERAVTAIDVPFRSTLEIVLAAGKPLPP